MSEQGRVKEIRMLIKNKEELKDSMVGSLYPRIVAKEIEDLRIELSALLEKGSKT